MEICESETNLSRGKCVFYRGWISGLRVPSRVVEARWRVFFCVRERILLGVNRMKSRECVRRIEVLSLIICYFRVLFVIIIIMNVANKLSK